MKAIIEALVSVEPVTVLRRVRWGDCDPAGVVYTPRFADYAVSAYEHFIASLVGDPPQTRLTALGLGFPMKGMDFDFRRSLRSEEDFEMVVRVAAIRTRTFDLSVEGRLRTGEIAFLIRLSPICVAAETRSSRPIPPELRGRLEDYRRRFPDPTSPRSTPA